VLKVSLGVKLSVNVQPEGVLLKAARPSFSLAELVALSYSSAPEPADMAA
jgi:antitoxin ChpS